MNSFITRWHEPFAGKEKRVVNIYLHGLTSDRAGRSPELLSVLFTRSYFTLASVARKVLSWFSLGKRTLSNYIFTGRDELFAERGI